MSGVEYLPPQASPQYVPEPPPAAADETLRQPPDRRRPRRFLPRTLTSRLVVGVVSLVVAIVLLIGGGTWYSFRSFLGARLDQQLETTANGPLRNLFMGQQQTPPDVRAPQDVWAVALTVTGNVITYPSSGGVEPMTLSSSDRKRRASSTSTSPTTVTTTNGYQLRVVSRPAVAASPGTGETSAIAIIGLSTDEEHRSLNRLVALELIIGGAAVALALGATSWGVRRSLRNLYQVTGTAREVAAELSPTGAGLERRVPVVEEGTEVGQLAESMNTLLSAVETQFAARLESEGRMRQFLADASHELRTPLTSIRGYAELSRMQRAAGEAEQDNLGRIESEGTRMSRLVDDLLMLARGDADATIHIADREPVAMAEVLDDAVNGSRVAFPDRPIDVEVAPMPTVSGDRDQLLRVVRNLVTNAAVHTEAGRAIHVRGFPDAGGVVITIVDGGPGLPPEQAAHVFERFWRADMARTRSRGGTGLGLAIVAAIVHAHGGTVRFDSTVEYGSTVTVWLPAVD
jgi:two-component system OmpR family sensor kinase